MATSDKPTTALERLHGDRAGLTGELATLNAASARLHAAANAEAAVLTEIGAMGSQDIAAMTAWASGGCIGDPPTPDLKQRRALAERLAAAQAAAVTATSAGQDINHQIGLLTERLAAITAQIQTASFDAMQAEWMAIYETHRVAVESTRALTAKLGGLGAYLVEQGRDQTDIRRNPDAGRRYFQRAEVLKSVRLTDPGITHGEVQEAVAFWSERETALRNGSAS